MLQERISHPSECEYGIATATAPPSAAWFVLDVALESTVSRGPSWSGPSHGDPTLNDQLKHMPRVNSKGRVALPKTTDFKLPKGLLLLLSGYQVKAFPSKYS